jgi:hypothetical protein
MDIYFTIHKSPTESLTVIFKSCPLSRARRYMQGLVSTGKYRENQIAIGGTDSGGRLVDA